MKLTEIAKKLSCKIEGDGNIEITGLATLETARQGELSFLTNPKYFSEAKVTRASAIIAGRDCPPMTIPILMHENPYLTFAKAIEIFHPPPQNNPFIHPTAVISETVSLGKDISIGAYTYIGKGVSIGDRANIGPHCVLYDGAAVGEDSIIHSGAIIREDVKIGKSCIIQNNAVIGADGFGFAKQDDGAWYKIIQAGSVVIEDNVEIGACTTVDRATLGETKISRGSKLDNLVQIGHGSEIGKSALICAQVGLAGSTKIGNNVILAGQVGVAGHLTIGDRTIVTPQTGIPNSIAPDKIVSGSPAIDHKKWLKASAITGKLPEIQKVVRDLEKRVARLEITFKETSEETLVSLKQ